MDFPEELANPDIIGALVQVSLHQDYLLCGVKLTAGAVKWCHLSAIIMCCDLFYVRRVGQ